MVHVKKQLCVIASIHQAHTAQPPDFINDNIMAENGGVHENKKHSSRLHHQSDHLIGI